MNNGCADNECRDHNILGWGVVLGLTIVLLLITVGLVCFWLQVDE
ncbi:MAG: hypothetical protein ACOX5M_00545 [Bacillota bacterium]|jgi:hypothetical protein